jgi:di/tricarboxylate transporter
MPLSYSVLAGSFGSMIGTSTNLTLQGLMEEDRDFAFPFFAPLPIGLACFVVLLVYQTIAAPYLLPHHKSGLIREARDHLRDHIAEIYVSKHASAVGNTVSAMMNSLGVAPSHCFKIRRRGPRTASARSKDNESIGVPKPNSIIDRKYLKEFGKFWFSSPKIPDRLSTDEGASTESKDIEASEEEDYRDIIAPEFFEVIQEGDIVFVSSGQDAVEKMMKSIMGESRGLYILKGNVMALPGFGTELIECVLSDSSPLVGMRVEDATPIFAERYKAGLITVRGKNWGVDAESAASSPSVAESKSETQQNNSDEIVRSGDVQDPTVLGDSADPGSGIELKSSGAAKESVSVATEDRRKHVVVSEHILQYGDTVLCVTSRKNVDNLTKTRDFFVVSTVGDLPKPITLYSFFPLIIFVAMLAVVAAEMIEMCPAALTVTAFFFMGGWIKPKDIPKMVDIRLLMLMGCSLSFAKAMTTTGLASRLAESINSSNPSNFGALMLVYVITLVITELISNNAAAALMYPLSVALADELKLSFKPFAMAVLVASTAGFMSPIGYQTHVMVWGPGGYRFRDFIIFGFIPDIIYWVVGCSVILWIYPF